MPPARWTRAQYIYGWPLPWKGEFGGLRGSYYGLALLIFDCFFWLWYSMFLCGFRKPRQFVKGAIIGVLASMLLNLLLELKVL